MATTLKRGLAILLAAMCIFSFSVAAMAANDYIGEEKAKAIALEYAGIAQSEAKYLTVRFELDDGIATYDVSFTSGNIEYDVEINASTGAVLEFDRDLTWIGEILFWITRVLAFFRIK